MTVYRQLNINITHLAISDSFNTTGYITSTTRFYWVCTNWNAPHDQIFTDAAGYVQKETKTSLQVGGER